MVANIGTKALTSVRLEFFQTLMGLGKYTKVTNQRLTDPQKISRLTDHHKIRRLTD